MAVAAAVALGLLLGQVAGPPPATPGQAVATQLRALNTRTDDGAGAVIALLLPALTAPRGEVDGAARGL